MNKESLFELIRSEEVTLWAGAGLSLYAGYPSGPRTAAILYESFPESFRDELDASKPLPQFVDDYINLQSGSLNKLIRVLNRIFLAEPTSIEYHKIIASIPHIKTIITTNYDRLFELAYGSSKLYTVLSNTNLSYIDKSKATLFKIHGDLQDPNSILIASKDYRRFFIDKQDQPLWRYIESILTTKPVVFAGYSLDDINILTMYEGLLNKFGSHMPPAYLVVPTVSKIKQKELDRLKITHIAMTGENFFTELLQNVKDNILSDVELGVTSADTFKKFMDSHELKANLHIADGGFDVSNIQNAKGKTTGEFKLSFQRDSYLQDAFMTLASGLGHEPLVIDAKDLSDIDFRIEDLKVPVKGQREFRFVFTPAPIHEGLYDIFFDDFELSNILVKIFRIENGARLIAKLYTAEITFNAYFSENAMNTNFLMTNNLETDECPVTSTKEQIDIYSLVENLSLGKKFRFFSHSNNLVKTLQAEETDSSYARRNKNYFIKLRDIERAFNIRFTYFKNINEDAKDALYLHKAVSGAIEEVEAPIAFPILDASQRGTEQESNLLKHENDEDTNMVLQETGSYTYNLHGQEIKTNINRAFKFMKPEFFDNQEGGLSVRSIGNRFLVTYSYSPYSSK